MHVNFAFCMQSLYGVCFTPRRFLLAPCSQAGSAALTARSAGLEAQLQHERAHFGKGEQARASLEGGLNSLQARPVPSASCDGPAVQQ